MQAAESPYPPVALGDAVDRHLLHTVGVAPASADRNELMRALAHAVRAELARRWVDGEAADKRHKVRRVYYLAMEFLMGGSLGNALDALELRDEAASHARAHACRLEEVESAEPDAGLGNGGLGRLAACFLDAMATRGLPSYGYGIRYEFGMFAQAIQGVRQVERPDPWLADGTPWEFPRAAVHYPVRFGGWVERPESPDARPVWRHAAEVDAKAFDHVVPGHGTDRVATTGRSWPSRSAQG